MDIPSWVGGVAKLCCVADAVMDAFGRVCVVDNGYPVVSPVIQCNQNNKGIRK